MSLQTLATGKPKSKLRGITCFMNLSCDAPLRPLPALMAAIITAGSRPPLTPATQASDAIANAVADGMMFSSLSSCAWPWRCCCG